MTGISSTIGYLRPQSLQMNHASLCSLSSPPVVRTQFGQRRISISVWLIINSPIHNQYFTKIERFPENRGAAYVRTPVFGLLLFIDLLVITSRKFYHNPRFTSS